MLYHQTQDNETIDNALFLHEYLNTTFCLNPQIKFEVWYAGSNTIGKLLLSLTIWYSWYVDYFLSLELIKISEGRDIWYYNWVFPFENILLSK